MPPRKILVVGATGKQGSAFVRAALTPSSNDDASGFHLLALTRNTTSEAAQKLAGLGDRITVATADLDNAESVRKVFEDEKAKPEGGIWGVFLALAFPGLGVDASGEEAQCKLVTDLACEYNVQHLIYSSAERGDDSRDEHAELSHLAKAHNEKYVKSKQGLNWTILRPVWFMENFEGLIGRITLSVLRVGLKRDTKLQLIAAEDIGRVAFAVMQKPEAYRGQAICVLGDALTVQEVQDAYARGAGRAMPGIPNIMARGLSAMNKHTRGVVEAIENVHADRIKHNIKYEDLIARCREVYPGMQTYEEWTKTHSGQAERKAGWNGVSLASLLSGKM